MFVMQHMGHRDNRSKLCKKKESKAYNLEDEHLTMDQFVTMEQSPVEHHIQDGKWISRPSKPHPVVMTSDTNATGT